MNEKFLSRGKREDNGEWIIGYYVKIPNKVDKLNKWCHIIIDLDGRIGCIIPETLGRCTDLTDKNDTLIFEGDIVNCSCGCPHEVIYVKEYAGTYGGGMPAFYLSDMNDGYAWIGSEEVVGNVYDNPELLEEVAQNGG